MRIHFLTTKLGKASGGAIYDQDFYNILRKKFPDVKLFDDEFFLNMFGNTGQGAGLIEFNDFYKKYADRLYDCEYLIINSRLYTRFVKTNLNRILRKYRNVRFLVIHHHNNYMNHKGLLYIIHRHFEMRILKKATQLIIPNQYVIDQLKKTYQLNNIICLPSSFEKKKYEISNLNTGNILFVGNIERRKGLMYGLKAFHLFSKMNKNYKFRIAGKFDENDSYYKKIKDFVAEKGLSGTVIFEGRVSDERLEWLYSHSDLFLFPSLLEGYGWVMIEAMGRGVPVMAFDNSAMPYTVKNNYNGILVDNLDWEKMGNSIVRLLSDKEMLKKLQQGALKTYEEVPSKATLKQQIESFIETWE
nr:glycosyltransferase family 4 protein [uncultured Acetatifactor sp.]